MEVLIGQDVICKTFGFHPIGRAKVTAEISGVLRGVAHTGIAAEAGCKVGDIDPRSDPMCCFTISDKANAIAGGVMEAVFHHFRIPS